MEVPTYEPAVRTAGSSEHDDDVEEYVPKTRELRMCKARNCKNDYCIFLHSKEKQELLMQNENLPWIEMVQTTAVRSLAKVTQCERLLSEKDAKIEQLQMQISQLQQEVFQYRNQNSRNFSSNFNQSSKGAGRGYVANLRGQSSGAVRRAPSTGRM